jgi:tetratricopeptide (TPR) repeat protein
MRTILRSFLLPCVVAGLLFGAGAALAQVLSADLPEAQKKELDALPDDVLRMERISAWISKDPENARLHFHLGNYAFDAGKLAEAAKAYEQAITLEPKLVGAHVNLGSVYDELNRLDDAIASYRKALELQPNEDRTLCNMGNVYFKKRQYERAIEHFQLALQANPKSQLAHYNLAILFADAGIYKEAIREWESAVAIDPESDLGRRSAENAATIRTFLDAEIPELDGR